MLSYMPHILLPEAGMGWLAHKPGLQVVLYIISQQVKVVVIFIPVLTNKAKST